MLESSLGYTAQRGTILSKSYFLEVYNFEAVCLDFGSLLGWDLCGSILGVRNFCRYDTSTKEVEPVLWKD
eukprot:3659622-Amphidinium_carterae.1